MLPPLNVHGAQLLLPAKSSLATVMPPVPVSVAASPEEPDDPDVPDVPDDPELLLLLESVPAQHGADPAAKLLDS